MRNKSRVSDLDILDVHFVAFHVAGSLDGCHEIQETGIRNLQYVLSHDTMLSRQLNNFNIQFDIENREILIGGRRYNVDYKYYRKHPIEVCTDESVESIAHRLYYDYCISGFFANDHVEDYGTQIHQRPEFILKLLKLSPHAHELDTFWRKNSTPYKILFYATAEQIHKFTFDLKQSNEPYTKFEEDAIRKWMLINAIDRAFEPCGERFIYIRDEEYIPPNQIIRCEPMLTGHKQNNGTKIPTRWK